MKAETSTSRAGAPRYRLGINHHLLFPAGMEDPATHERTFSEVLAYPEFAVVDFFLAGDPAQREREARLLRESGRAGIYNFPLLHLVPGCNPNASDPDTLARTRDAALRHLDAAVLAGAEMVTIASGPNPAPEGRAQAWAGWVDYLEWLGREAAARDLRAVIEPFDQSIGKNLLVGPTTVAVRSVEAVRARGVDSIGLMVDMGHLAVMEEEFAHAVNLSLPYLWHIHLGSAVIRHPAHPWYGDFHPPLGLPEGEYDTPDLAAFLGVLCRSGYLDNPGATLSLEMRPYPDRSPRASVECWLQMLAQAWEMVGEEGALAS